MAALEIPVFISKEEIEGVVSRIGSEIYKNLQDNRAKEVNFVTILEGARPFSRDLRAKVTELCGQRFPINNYDIKISSYQGTQSEKLALEKDIEVDITGRDLIVVEDIVDTGKTMNYLINHLFMKRNARSMCICSLLNKPSRREKDIPIVYLGKNIPDEFVIGYGLDKDGEFRGLDYIGIWKE